MLTQPPKTITGCSNRAVGLHIFGLRNELKIFSAHNQPFIDEHTPIVPDTKITIWLLDFSRSYHIKTHYSRG